MGPEHRFIYFSLLNFSYSSHNYYNFFDVLGCSGMIRVVSGCFGMFRDVSGCSMFMALSVAGRQNHTTVSGWTRRSNIISSNSTEFAVVWNVSEFSKYSLPEMWREFNKLVVNAILATRNHWLSTVLFNKLPLGVNVLSICSTLKSLSSFLLVNPQLDLSFFEQVWALIAFYCFAWHNLKNPVNSAGPPPNRSDAWPVTFIINIALSVYGSFCLIFLYRNKRFREHIKSFGKGSCISATKNTTTYLFFN